MSQLKKTKWLFVCTSGQCRSPTASDMFATSSRETKYAGLDCYGKWKTRKELESVVKWADTIFVMELDHEIVIRGRFPELEQQSVVNLDIPDDYDRGELKLKRLLLEKMAPYIN